MDDRDRRVEAALDGFYARQADSMADRMRSALAAADAVDDRDRAYRALFDLVATTDLRSAPEDLKDRIGEIIREGESRSSGAVSQGEEDRRCERCRGYGWIGVNDAGVRMGYGPGTNEVDCPACGGSGSQPPEPEEMEEDRT